jgi:hypothetical protein
MRYKCINKTHCRVVLPTTTHYTAIIRLADRWKKKKKKKKKGATEASSASASTTDPSPLIPPSTLLSRPRS